MYIRVDGKQLKMTFITVDGVKTVAQPGLVAFRITELKYPL